MARRRLPRALSAEERALWRRIEASATPLHPQRRVVPPEPRLAETARPARPAPARADLSRLEIGGQPPRGPAADLAPTLEERFGRWPARMDAKAFGRMKRGKLPVEGRVDLHGMTLAEAQPRLHRFILSAHGARKRLVLVITGKGRDRDDDGPMPARRGVLRHQVPLWLRSGPLAAIVQEIAPAHRSHGGTGAYYVYLRRRG